jgi:hypothetical protein
MSSTGMTRDCQSGLRKILKKPFSLWRSWSNPEISTARISMKILENEGHNALVQEYDISASLFPAIQPVKKFPKPRNFTSSFRVVNLI